MIASIIILALLGMSLGISLAKHGQPKEGKYNFWLQLFATIIELILFYSAGLFDKFFR